MDKAVTEVGLAQIMALSVSLANVEQWLQILSLILAVSFGVYKWYVEIKKFKKKCKGVKRWVFATFSPVFSLPLHKLI